MMAVPPLLTAYLGDTSDIVKLCLIVEIVQIPAFKGCVVLGVIVYIYYRYKR